MIPRYSRPAMTAIWSPATKFRIWFALEAHASDAPSALRVIPNSPAAAAWQARAAGARPAGDADCDGCTTDAENFMGTDPNDTCAGTATADDEEPPDAWPVDADDNQFVNLLDVLPMKQHFNTTDPDPDYNPRFDLKDQDGTINLLDVLPYKAFFLTSCAP